MKPSRRYQELAESINRFMNYVGLEILTPRLQFGSRLFVTGFAIMCYTGFSIWWIIKQPSWVDVMKASIMMGGLFTATTEIYTILLRQQDIRRMTIITRQIYEDYEERSVDYCDALNSAFDRLLDTLRLMRVGYLVSYTVMCALPLILLAYDGTRTTIVQYHIPGLPLKTALGFTLTYLAHLLSIVIAGTGFYAGDMLGSLALMQILTYSGILQVKVRDLNAVLELKVEERRTAFIGTPFSKCAVLNWRLRDTFMWHQLFTKYCKDVDTIFHVMIAGQVVAMPISMLCCFCVILNEFHIISVISFVISMYRMCVYCIMGTQIEYAYDQVYESICSISWYELDGSQRKMFAMMLKEAQNSETMMIVGILPLSVRTALKITKLIYSLGMMMMQNRT